MADSQTAIPQRWIRVTLFENCNCHVICRSIFPGSCLVITSSASDTGSLKAKENLNKAIEIFKQCGADGWVEKYEKELAAL